MANSWRSPVSLLLLLAAGSVSAQLTETERKGLEDTLFLANISTDELVFARRPYSDVYRLPIVDLSIDRPMETIDRLMGAHSDGLKLGVGQLIKLASTDLLGDVAATGAALPRPSAQAPTGIPPALATVVAEIAKSTWEANEAVSVALGNLTDEEKATLLQSLPGFATEEPSIKFGWVSKPQASQEEVLRLVSRINLPTMRSAAQKLANAIQSQMDKLKSAAASKWVGKANFTYLGLKIEVSGVGDDFHSKADNNLTIDLGGNDRYTGRDGGGMVRASVLIDLGGDDVYKVPDLSAGAGLLGIGLAYDMGGLDVFRGKSLCFGAGLAGVGLFLKDGGHDYYSSVALTQGFGEFGIGLLVDTRGDDTYEAGIYAQGSARTQGVGWLQDRSGGDTYRLGGLILNSPLFADVYYSMGQGYSGGYRDDAGGVSGGVGLISDAGGDDSYIGATYCQAASYWFALGSLYDVAGHDSYKAYHYAQASAMHMTGAYLFDLAGDDLYSVNFGAAHSIGHDYGTSLLLDRAGNDIYSARDDRPGTGNANGLGIFIDTLGDDRYFGIPSAGNPARGSGSLGVFADLQGFDLYREGLADAQGAVRPEWASAYDAETTIQTASAPAAAAATPTPGSQPMPAADKMADLYKKATQWGVGTAQKEVDDSIAQLIAIGMPAFEWMVTNRLTGASRLEQRAFVEVMKGVGDPARGLVASRIGSDNVDEARVAILVCVDGVVKEAGPFLPKALDNPKLARNASRAAGLVGAKETVPQLMVLAAGADRITALFSLVSLAQIKDETAYSTGETLLKAPELPIRKAALDIVAGFPDQAMATAGRLTKENDERSMRIGIELLSKIGTPAALTEIVPFLADPRPGVRIQALLALSGRVPETARTAVQERLKDVDPRVRAVAATVK